MKTEQQLAQKLNAILAEGVTIVDAQIVGAAHSGGVARFTYTNPVSGVNQSAEGELFGDVSSGAAIGLYSEAAKQWFLVSPDAVAAQSPSLNQFVRRRPQVEQDLVRVPMALSRVKGVEVEISLLDGPYWNVLEMIPLQRPGCPPKTPDPDAPPLPAGSGWPGYYIYYFLAHNPPGTFSPEECENPGFPPVPALAYPYWSVGGVYGMPYFERPWIAQLNPANGPITLASNGGGLQTANFQPGLYGVSAADFTRVEGVVDQKKASNERVDFSAWARYEIPGSTLQVRAFEIVASFVPGIPDGSGGFTPPDPPPNPSGPKMDVLPNYHPGPFGSLNSAVLVQGFADGGHGWQRFSRRWPFPPPPDYDGDGVPDYAPVDNNFEVFISAHRHDNYVILRHMQNCDDLFGEIKRYKVSRGVVTPNLATPEAWRSIFLSVPSVVPNVLSDKCIRDFLKDPKVNLFGPHIFKLKENPEAPILAQLQILKGVGGTANVEIIKQQFQPAPPDLLSCIIRSEKRQKFQIKSRGLPPAEQSGSHKIESYAPVYWSS